MGKKIHLDLKKNISKIIFGIIAIVLLVCAARILIWEHYYYEEKEGSEREASVSSPVEDEDVDETDVSDADKTEYNVAGDRPRYLSISKLGIKNSRVLPVGLTNSRQLATPNNIFDVGWYTESAKPGQDGAMVIDGHNGGPTKSGVFKNLPSLAEGDIIEIERGDGTTFKYRVVENNEYSLDEANENMNKMFSVPDPKKNKQSVSLITCSGEWSDIQKTYLSRQFVRAVLTN